MRTGGKSSIVPSRFVLPTFDYPLTSFVVIFLFPFSLFPILFPFLPFCLFFFSVSCELGQGRPLRLGGVLIDLKYLMVTSAGLSS